MQFPEIPILLVKDRDTVFLSRSDRFGNSNSFWIFGSGSGFKSQSAHVLGSNNFIKYEIHLWLGYPGFGLDITRPDKSSSIDPYIRFTILKSDGNEMMLKVDDLW